MKVTVPDLLETGSASAEHSFMEVRVIWRDRELQSPVKMGTVLADTYSRQNSQDAVVNGDTGYLVVDPGESVIILSQSNSSGGEYSFFLHLKLWILILARKYVWLQYRTCHSERYTEGGSQGWEYIFLGFRYYNHSM